MNAAQLQHQQAYLRTKVLTANPEQLRLMLYEGAVKFCRQARDALSRKDYEGMYNGLVRAQKIVLELSTSLDHKVDPVLCERLASLYNYVYMRLVDANMERDLAAIDEAIHLIDYERQTWVMLLDQLTEERESGRDPVAEARQRIAEENADAADSGFAPADASTGPLATIGPRGAGDDEARRGGFSIEG